MNELPKVILYKSCYWGLFLYVVFDSCWLLRYERPFGVDGTIVSTGCVEGNFRLSWTVPKLLSVDAASDYQHCFEVKILLIYLNS